MNNSFTRIASRRNTRRLMLTADLNEVVGRVTAMSPDEKKEFVTDFVNGYGLAETINAVKNIFTSVVGLRSSAAMYEAFNEVEKQKDKTGLVEKITDKLDLLIIILLVGAGGTVEMEGVMAGLKVALGAAGVGFLSWALRAIKEAVR